MKRKGIVLIISDFKFQSGWKELVLLARKHDVIAIRISDPSDTEIPARGTVEYRDSESGRSVVVYNLNNRIQQEYANYWRDQFYFWEEICTRRKIQMVTVSTDDDPVTRLLSAFKEVSRK